MREKREIGEGAGRRERERVARGGVEVRWREMRGEERVKRVVRVTWSRQFWFIKSNVWKQMQQGLRYAVVVVV